MVEVTGAGGAAEAGRGKSAAGGEVAVRFLGHACFLLEWRPGGGGRPVRVVTDPFPADMGYGPLGVTADVVVSSHDDFDHDAAGAVGGEPQVFVGTSGKKRNWVSVDQAVKGVRVKGFPNYHDSSHGRERGKNTSFLIEIGGLRLVHLGDLGHLLSPEQSLALRPVDVLFVPVGGHFTIDAAQAWQVVDALEPRVAVPMHFLTPAVAQWPLAPLDDFLRARPQVKVVRAPEARLVAGELPPGTEVWVVERR